MKTIHFFQSKTLAAIALLLTLSFGAFAQVTANFHSNHQNGCAPFTVEFIDQSTGLVNDWLWDFGDGDSSMLQNPIHVYTHPGLYSVTLSVFGSGMTNSFTQQDYILVSSIIVTAAVTNANCNSANGNIDLTVTTGMLPVHYIWSNGATTQDLSNLTAGNYTVVVEDSLCRFQETYHVLNAGNMVLSASVSATSSPAASDGAINLTVTGGTPPYDFNWTTTGDSTEDLSGLPAGTYCVLVTDANGCIEDGCFTVSNGGCSNFHVADQVTQINCATGTTGAINLTVTGGTAPYFYAWSNGSHDEDIFNLQPGPYTITVEDSGGCREVKTYTITALHLIVITGSETSASAPGMSDGAVNITVTGGAGGYTYSWNNGAYLTEDISGIPAGSYCVLVTDTNGCHSDHCFTVGTAGIGCSGFTVTGQVNHNSCNSLSNGSIDVTVSGGTLPYFYVWSTGSHDQDIQHLAGGTYSVTVEDSGGCREVRTFTVNSSTPITISGLVTSGTPLLGGSIDITVTGGTPPYSYNWVTTGDSTEDLNGLAPGTYCVLVTDANGCIEDLCFTVNNGGCTNFHVADQVTHIGCNNTPAGSITLTVTGGTAPYFFAWSNGSHDHFINNLTAGTYSVTVEDSGGCREVKSYTIGYAGGFQINGTVTHGTSGAADGAINITHGGTPPFTYSWSNGATTQNIDNLAPGQYCVLVTDSNLCTEDQCFTIVANGCNGFRVTAWNDIFLCGPDSFVLEANAYDGTAPYSFHWIPSNYLNHPNNRITSGYVSSTTTFQVTATDANGCTATDEVIVFTSNPSGGTGVWFDSINICRGDTVQVGAFGGTSYFWDPSSTVSDPHNNDPLAFPLHTTDYVVTIHDSNSLCTGTVTVHVEVDEDCVWPGDANHDGVANNNDVLAIGIGYGINGPARPNATLNWEGQFAPDWLLALASGPNLKHVDCNGDGTINSSDTAAISLNYGQTHNKRGPTGKITDPIIYFEIPTDTALAGTHVNVPVYLGRDTLPVNNFYGIAFSINYDNTLVEEGTVSFDAGTSWVGTLGVNLLSFQRDLYPQAKIDIAQTRINQVNVSGFGQIGVLSFTMKDDISGKDLLVKALNLSFSDIKAISNTESDISIFSGTSTIYVVQELTGILTPGNISDKISIYPNPGKNRIRVDFSGMEIMAFSIFNLLGQQIETAQSSNKQFIILDVSGLKPGNYFLQVKSRTDVISKKLVILE